MSRILALDLATVTGWAVARPDAPPFFGTERIAPPHASDGEFMHRFENWVSDMIAVHQPELLVYEAPILWAGKTDIRTAARLASMPMELKKLAYRRQVPHVVAANMSDVRMWFLGRARGRGEDRKGRRAELKGAIIEECRRRGWPVQTDDEADARAILAWAEHAWANRERLPLRSAA